MTSKKHVTAQPLQKTGAATEHSITRIAKGKQNWRHNSRNSRCFTKRFMHTMNLLMSMVSAVHVQ